METTDPKNEGVRPHETPARRNPRKNDHAMDTILGVPVCEQNRGGR